MSADSSYLEGQQFQFEIVATFGLNALLKAGDEEWFAQLLRSTEEPGVHMPYVVPDAGGVTLVIQRSFATGHLVASVASETEVFFFLTRVSGPGSM